MDAIRGAQVEACCFAMRESYRDIRMKIAGSLLKAMPRKAGFGIYVRIEGRVEGRVDVALWRLREGL